MYFLHKEGLLLGKALFFQVLLMQDDLEKPEWPIFAFVYEVVSTCAKLMLLKMMRGGGNIQLFGKAKMNTES